MNKKPVPASHKKDVGMPCMSKNERVKFEMRILKYRQIARQMAANPEEARRIAALVAELEKKLREIDE